MRRLIGKLRETARKAEVSGGERCEPPAPEIDAASLPDCDKLDGDSDYRPFLRKNVPTELKRLGLRRAWASDPTIAAFRGFADYDWDANAIGYGELSAADAAIAAASWLVRDEPEARRGQVTEAGDAGEAGPRPEDEKSA